MLALFPSVSSDSQSSSHTLPSSQQTEHERRGTSDHVGQLAQFSSEVATLRRQQQIGDDIFRENHAHRDDVSVHNDTELFYHTHGAVFTPGASTQAVEPFDYGANQRLVSSSWPPLLQAP